MDTTRLSERLDTAFDTRLFEIGGTPITAATLITLAAIVLFTGGRSRMRESPSPSRSSTSISTLRSSSPFKP